MSKPSARPAEAIRYPRERITAGILAGGRATRMGGADKGLVELRGRAMVAYVLEALRDQAAQALISANRNIKAYRRFGVRVVTDRIEGFQGPLAGIASMMDAAGTEWLLVSPCDGPRVPRDLGIRLWRAIGRDGAEIGVAHSGDRLEPVFALLPCALRGDLEAYLAAGRRQARGWYQRHRMAIADLSDCADRLVNVNTPAERDAAAAGFRADADGPAVPRRRRMP